MSKSYRIRTQPGENGYLKVNLDLNQNYDPTNTSPNKGQNQGDESI